MARSAPRPRRAATAVFGALAMTLTSVSAPAASAASADHQAQPGESLKSADHQAQPGESLKSTDALIAEVYGGGGNSGATLTTDFVELANVSGAVVALDGLSVQYLPASPKPTSQWQVTALAGAIAPGGRYLVAEATGSGGGTPLPTADATGSINMSGSAGTVALVAGTAALTCLTAADCAADSRVRDLVGYGAAVVREGSPAAATSATTSVARPADPATGAVRADTDDNSADFTAGAPTPTNAAGQTPGDGGSEPGPDPEPEPEPEPVTVRVHDIQGTTRISPLNGKQVSGVPGIVTAVRSFGSARGFWVQDTEPDADPRTSEGLFVFTGSTTPSVRPGDQVRVSGVVSEYRPGGEDSANQTVTELKNPQWTVLAAGAALPAAEILGPDTVPETYAPEAGGESIEKAVLAPADYALDFYESREGMLLRVDDARVVGPSDDYSALWVTTKPEQHPSARGGTVYLGYDRPNSGRLKVESPTGEGLSVANVGDRLTGTTAGPLDYSQYGGYVLAAATLGKHVSGGLTPETTRRQRPGELAVATYNVENLSPADDQTKFDRLAKAVVTNLASPDVLALEEIQDNSGPTNDGVVAADVTLTRFTDAIKAAGGPAYQWRQIDPVNQADGGQPGGNIRVAFLFNPKRVSFVDRPGGDATTPVSVVRHGFRPALSISPGRIDPGNAAWQDSRKPLAGEFVFHGRTVFVVANHFASKGGDQPMHGRYQPPTRGSEAQRQQQATVLRGFVDQLRAVDRRATVVLAGDLNDYQFSRTLDTLTRGGAVRDLIDELPAAERYSYVYEGNSQVLDHILVGGRPRTTDYDVVHVNAEFADQVSDHDPQVLRMRLAPPTGFPWLDDFSDSLTELADGIARFR